MHKVVGAVAVVHQDDEVRQILPNLGAITIRLCLLFIHPRAPNLINLRSAGTMPA